MAFNVLEYLRDGKVDFVYHQTPYDKEHLISLIRNAPNRIEIINGFLDKLRDDMPSYCYHIIYDIKEFSKEAYELLDEKILSPSMLKSVLYNTDYNEKLLQEKFDYFLNRENYDEYLKVIIEYAISTNNQELIHKLSRYKNLHIRFLFMKYIIENYPKLLDSIYDNITKYTTEYTYDEYEQLTFIPELMDPKDISELAILLLKNNRKKDYQELKDYIMSNYKYNYLASQLLKNMKHHSDRYNLAFKEDADSLFASSKDYRYFIYLRHRKRISEKLMEEFTKRIKYFEHESFDMNLMSLYSVGLGPELESLLDKYLDLSTRKDYEYVGAGTTCSCFRIGDYAFKLVKTKWSYEDVICPNIYLIAKNLEEIYLRDRNGVVYGGIEIQKYLSRTTDGINPKFFRYFDLALDRLGYKRTDTLTGGVCGENTMLLDSYKDADCSDPSKLPVWFKQYPIVLIDRDRIYPKDKEYIKQLTSGY